MTMQRRHFELIAETLRDSRVTWATAAASTSPAMVHATRTIHEELAEAFSRKLSATNPNFNTARFLRACGVED